MCSSASPMSSFNAWRLRLPPRPLLLLLVLVLARQPASAESGRSDVSQRPEFMSAAHYQRTRQQQQDEFRLVLSCSPDLAKPGAYDVNPPPLAPLTRAAVPAQQSASGRDRLTWLRRRQADTHSLTGDSVQLLAMAVSPPGCDQARLISSLTAPVNGAGSTTTIALIDVKDCGLAASIDAVRRLPGRRVGLLLVFNAPPSSAKSFQEDEEAAEASALAGSIVGQTHSPPPPLPVVLYEPAELASRLLAELQLANRSCTVSYLFRSVGSDGLINKTSVLFVSVSFILLMLISLSWLIFYYVQRFRYLHAKERLSRRLGNAAKKALTKIPVKVLKTGDKEFHWIGDQCAVCIEPYRCGESVRVLPCRHFYHKSCIDPWLLDQRSCPLCKLDILKACGLHIHRGSHASLLDSHLSAEHSHAVASSAAAAAVAAMSSGASASAAAASMAGSVHPPTLLSLSMQAAGGPVGCGGRRSIDGSPSNSQSDEGGVQVTIEPPDVQYHHSNNSSVQCAPYACRQHDSSDAASAASASSDAVDDRRLQQQQQQQAEAAEVCYPLVHRHHGSG